MATTGYGRPPVGQCLWVQSQLLNAKYRNLEGVQGCDDARSHLVAQRNRCMALAIAAGSYEAAKQARSMMGVRTASQTMKAGLPKPYGVRNCIIERPGMFTTPHGALRPYESYKAVTHIKYHAETVPPLEPYSHDGGILAIDAKCGENKSVRLRERETKLDRSGPHERTIAKVMLGPRCTYINNTVTEMNTPSKPGQSIETDDLGFDHYDSRAENIEKGVETHREVTTANSLWNLPQRIVDLLGDGRCDSIVDEAAANLDLLSSDLVQDGPHAGAVNEMYAKLMRESRRCTLLCADIRAFGDMLSRHLQLVAPEKPVTLLELCPPGGKRRMEREVRYLCEGSVVKQAEAEIEAAGSAAELNDARQRLRAILKRQKQTKQSFEEARWWTMLEAHVESVANRRDDTGKLAHIGVCCSSPARVKQVAELFARYGLPTVEYTGDAKITTKKTKDEDFKDPDAAWAGVAAVVFTSTLCVGVDARAVEFEAIYWDANVRGAPPRYSVQGIARFNRWFRECLIVYVLIRKPEASAASMALDSRRVGLKRKATQTQSDAAASSKRLRSKTNAPPAQDATADYVLHLRATFDEEKDLANRNLFGEIERWVFNQGWTLVPLTDDHVECHEAFVREGHLHLVGETTRTATAIEGATMADINRDNKLSNSRKYLIALAKHIPRMRSIRNIQRASAPQFTSPCEDIEDVSPLRRALLDGCDWNDAPVQQTLQELPVERQEQLRTAARPLYEWMRTPPPTVVVPDHLVELGVLDTEVQQALHEAVLAGHCWESPTVRSLIPSALDAEQCAQLGDAFAGLSHYVQKAHRACVPGEAEDTTTKATKNAARLAAELAFRELISGSEQEVTSMFDTCCGGLCDRGSDHFVEVGDMGTTQAAVREAFYTLKDLRQVLCPRDFEVFRQHKKKLSMYAMAQVPEYHRKTLSRIEALELADKSALLQKLQAPLLDRLQLCLVMDLGMKRREEGVWRTLSSDEAWRVGDEVDPYWFEFLDPKGVWKDLDDEALVQKRHDLVNSMDELRVTHLLSFEDRLRQLHIEKKGMATSAVPIMGGHHLKLLNDKLELCGVKLKRVTRGLVGPRGKQTRIRDGLAVEWLNEALRGIAEAHLDHIKLWCPDSHRGVPWREWGSHRPCVIVAREERTPLVKMLQGEREEMIDIEELRRLCTGAMQTALELKEAALEQFQQHPVRTLGYTAKEWERGLRRARDDARIALDDAKFLLEMAVSGGGKVSVRYGYAVIECFGRRYAVCGGRRKASLQGIKRVARCAAGRRYYVDIDLSMCFQAIIYNVLRIRGGYSDDGIQTEFPFLWRYMNEKAEIRREIADHYGCSIKAAKQLLLSLTHGGTPYGWLLENKLPRGKQAPAFVQGYIQEIHSKILGKLIAWFPEIAQYAERTFREKEHGSRLGWKARALATILQTREDRILQSIEDYFTSQGRNVDTLIFDGCLVRRRENGSGVSDEELRACEAHIKAKLGFTMTLEASELQV